MKLIPRQLLEAQLCRHNSQQQLSPLGPRCQRRNLPGIPGNTALAAPATSSSQPGWFSSHQQVFPGCKWELAHPGLQMGAAQNLSHPRPSYWALLTWTNSHFISISIQQVTALSSSENIWANIRLKSSSSFRLIGYCHLKIFFLNLVLNKRCGEQNDYFIDSK